VNLDGRNDDEGKPRMKEVGGGMDSCSSAPGLEVTWDVEGWP